LGRSEPYYSYGNSGSASMSVSLKFVAISDYTADVFKKVHECRSLVYPMPNEGIKGTCILVIGSLLIFQGVCNSVSVRLIGPFQPSTYYAMVAEVSVDLAEAHDTPLNANMVMGGTW
jgi:hypothetical protein